MYRLTNLTLDTTTTYKNKDLVLQAIERENAKANHQEAEGLLLVEELDKKGVVVYQEDIFLPFEGIADSLFLKNGTSTTSNPKPKEKKHTFLKRSESKNNQESSSKEKQALRKLVSDTASSSDKSSSSNNLLKVLGIGGVVLVLLTSLSLAGFATSFVFRQNKQVASLTQQVKQLENLQSETGKLDAFARYFLPHYYSEQGKLGDFVAPKLDLKHQPGQLQSVILESSSQTDNQTYQLTYVLAIKNGENGSQKRLTMTVKQTSSAVYNYQVIAKPELADYPK
ncbi:hypothetical protein [Streptococcus anginosus]|uniref:hypothetical protein n=1 Tax=Streptococcus anginosus TaxID=1328 RepID=UPI0003919F12|nr:hypothetical protein [Streptococcus anginosus]GAD41592.1 hypothetical protein ANG4_0186 [Streptococcus anginosus 1505]